VSGEDCRVVFTRLSKCKVSEFMQANSYWLYIVPWGINKAVNYVKETYKNPTMILAENGT
jgi:hypothetical protein